MNTIEELLAEQQARLAVQELDDSPPDHPSFDSPLKLEDRGITTGKRTDFSRPQVEWYQQLLWSKGTINKNTIAAKLRLMGRRELADTLEGCHSMFTVAQCKGCKRINKFPNRCDLKICPECQPRLAWNREKSISWWVKLLDQPKLVTLTAKNTKDFSAGHIEEFMKWFTNLRNRKFCDNWIGGFYSIEVTKEANHWHLHLHALVEARWIDRNELSTEWRSVTNGQGYIVDVRDARDKAYQKHVKKYVVKGSQLAAWTPEEVATFVDAFEGKRCFGVFGKLYGQRTKYREWIESITRSVPVCECGCTESYYYSESEFLEKDLVPESNTSTIPPPVLFFHPELNLNVTPNWVPK